MEVEQLILVKAKEKCEVAKEEREVAKEEREVCKRGA